MGTESPDHAVGERAILLRRFSVKVAGFRTSLVAIINPT
jgi:hypothetical protein